MAKLASVHIRFEANANCSKVQIAGSFNAWTPVDMQRDNSGWFSKLLLAPGSHQYKFIVDGAWVHDPSQPTVTDSGGNINNLVEIANIPEKHSGEAVYVAAIDQGTQSTRVILYNREMQPLLTHQEPLPNITPKPGWVEQDPMEILSTTKTCLRKIIEKAKGKGIELNSTSLKAIGITNQRETTILWNSITGKPLYNSIVWNDLRTESLVEQLKGKFGGQDRFRKVCGLPLSTYFSAVKIKWLMDNVPEVRAAINAGTCKFGTVDTWLLWNLTGGTRSGVHVTDVSNASRTMLLNLHTGQWDPEVAKEFGIPMTILPAVKSSAEVYGVFTTIHPNENYDNNELSLSLIQKVPISGVLGDQQAALVGQNCFNEGEVKSTYGTGCFMLINTGQKVVESTSGLLTTIGYKLGANRPMIYALEGSIAIAGAAVSWLTQNLGILKSSKEISELAGSVSDNGGVYFVPALSGLFAPHWRSDARGVIIGLTLHSTKGHVCRALLEAISFQTREILESAQKDAKTKITKLNVDGGMVQSDLLMQIQADIGNLTVVRPADIETTARGAAYAAGVGVGLWNPEDNNNTSNKSNDKNNNNNGATTFTPVMNASTREKMFVSWNRAVKLSYAEV